MANSPITPVKVNYATGDVLTAQNLDDEASAINRLAGYTTQATANSTKTLVVTDNRWQEFTGSTAGQIVVMPVVTTLGLGMDWVISNKSTQTIAVQSSGANAIATVAAGTDVRVTCILLTGTTAASWQTSIVGYTTSPAGAAILLGSSVLSGASAAITVSSIPATAKNLRVVVQAASNIAATSASCNVQFNADTTAGNYDFTTFNSSNGAPSSGNEHLAQLTQGIINVSGSTAPAGASGIATIQVPNYTGTVFHKMATVHNAYKTSTSTGGIVQQLGMMDWRSTAAITSVTINDTSGGQFIVGSCVYVYGDN